MRILLTGASSFSGFWFARELAMAGHQVVATYRRSSDGYDGLRARRVQALDGLVDRRWGIDFGSRPFLDVVAHEDFDLLLHHAAEMTDYRSWTFDALAATQSNTCSAREILTRMSGRGCRRLILTGSVFEPYEGIGDLQKRAFNPYGLSKHLTFELFRLEAERLGLSLGKFVIPNPFGPWEDMRFTSYLAKEWAANRRPTVATPVYVRDNIHVSLLALAYRRFCESMPEAPGLTRSTPSGYVESQGAFARRVSREIGARVPWSCSLTEAMQTEFPEPMIRTNSDLAIRAHPEWSESAAWDALSHYVLEFDALPPSLSPGAAL